MIDPFGFRGSWSGRERDVFFYNSPGQGRLFQMAFAMGLDFADDGRAIIPLDFDGDGDLDLVFSSLQNLRLLENRHPKSASSFVRVRVLDDESINPPLGAIVKVRTGTRTQQDYVKLTAGFQSQVPRDLHFGLGQSQGIDEIEVQWPDGRRRMYQDLKVDTLYVLSPNRRVAKAQIIPRWTNPPRKTKVRLLAQTAKRLDGTTSRLASRTNKPLVINFWAPWCKPCLREIPILKGLQDRFKNQVDWIGVSVETKDVKAVKQALEKHAWKAQPFFANDALLSAFFGDEGELPLPSTFVFDAEGNLLRAYFRPIQKTTLNTSLRAALESQDSAHLLVKLGDALFLRGEVNEAEEAYIKALKVAPKSRYALLGRAAVMRKRGEAEQALAYTKRALKVDPDFAYARWLEGLSYSQLGKEEMALKAYRKAVVLSPESARYLMTLGSAEFRSGNTDKAEAAFEALLKIDDQSLKAWLNLAKLQMSMRNPRAWDAVQAVLRIQPEHAEARQMEATLKRVLSQER